MKRLPIPATVVAVFALSMLPASAITNGEPDGDRHPNVAFIGCETEDGVFGPTGQLIAPTVVLTAGHVTTDFTSRFECSSVFVSFDPTFDPESSKRYEVTEIITHPRFNPVSLTNDVGVMILKKPVKGITPIQLPTERLLDEMKVAGTIQDQRFVTVGYGSDVDCDPRPCTQVFEVARRFAEEEFNGVSGDWITFQLNHTATGQGGFCAGDSGGPHFLGDSNVSVGVTSWATGGIGNTCLTAGQAHRLDTPSVRAFLSRFVGLP
jgi:secreted trypsin-like serine protease